MKYSNREELADKISVEGGTDMFMFAYGFDYDDVPEGDNELKMIVGPLLAAANEYLYWRERFEELLEEYW